MKRNRLRMLGIAMVFALLFSAVSVPAGTEETKDGWLSITVGDDRNEFDPGGIRLAIYLIATGDYGAWTMVDDFRDITVFIRQDGSASVDKTLSQIRQRIADRKIQPTDSAVTDDKGKLEFRNLAHGIYYTEMVSGPERLTVSAMLVSVPNSSGNVQVRAMAKYEYETPTPSPTPTLKPTFTPFVPPDVTPTPTPTPTATPIGSPTATPTQTPAPTDSTPPDVTPTLTPQPSPTDSVPPDNTLTPSDSPVVTPAATDKATTKPTKAPAKKPVKATREPVPTPAPPTPNTPVPKHAPTLQPYPGEKTVAIEDYEAALGLGNIQIHVGVCFE